jgi:hypothetical protein
MSPLSGRAAAEEARVLSEIRVFRFGGEAGAMRYIVEVAIEAEHLAHELSQMRTWLDHMKIHAVGFRRVPGANTCRVDFEKEQEARAFGQAFGGRILDRTAA